MFKLCICLTESSIQMSQLPVGSLSLSPPTTLLPLVWGALCCWAHSLRPPSCPEPGRGRWRQELITDPRHSRELLVGASLCRGPFDLPFRNCVTPQECSPTPISESQSVPARRDSSNPLVSPLPVAAPKLSPERESDWPNVTQGAYGRAGLPACGLWPQHSRFLHGPQHSSLGRGQ